MLNPSGLWSYWPKKGTKLALPCSKSNDVEGPSSITMTCSSFNLSTIPNEIWIRPTRCPLTTWTAIFTQFQNGHSRVKRRSPEIRKKRGSTRQSLTISMLAWRARAPFPATRRPSTLSHRTAPWVRRMAWTTKGTLSGIVSVILKQKSTSWPSNHAKEKRRIRLAALSWTCHKWWKKHHRREYSIFRRL